MITAVESKLAQTIGSWNFIRAQGVIILAYIVWNITPGLPHFDPYPFILLNLFMSFQASFLGPVILMAQHMQDERDRKVIHEDLDLSRATESQIRELVEIVKQNGDDIEQIRSAFQNKYPTRRG